MVVYYGTKRWTGPRCHRDMFRLEEIPEEFHPYINDYPLHIIEAAHFDEPELFETDLKLLFGCLKYQDHPKAFRSFIERHRQEFQALERDTYDMIAAYCHINQMKAITAAAAVTDMNEGSKINMYKAFDELERMAINKGREEGREEIVSLYIMNNIKAGTAPQKIKESLIQFFQLPAEVAEGYCRRALK